MKFAVILEDAPDADPGIRKTHMAAHLAFLEANGDSILSAGPLRDADGAGQGGLWLVEAHDASRVEALVRADPFWPTGLRKSVRVLEWVQVFADGAPISRPG